jgi:peroxiredoxin
MIARRSFIALAIAALTAKAFKVGSKLPSAKMHQGFPPEMVDLATKCKGKKLVLVGLPGAFTPT